MLLSPPRDRPRSDRVIGILAKHWTPGSVKTRLGASVGMEASARLHRCFLLHLMQRLLGGDFAHQLILAPSDRIADGQTLANETKSPRGQAETSKWRVIDQGEGDLGERMSRWFARQLAPSNTSSPTRHAVLIGADCPLIEQVDIDKAFSKLDQHDVVLGPAADGGYYLIGIRRCDSRMDRLLQQLFANMAWSQEDVYQTSINRLKEGGWSCASLETREDIDTIDELENLITTLESKQVTDEQRALLNQIQSITPNLSIK